MLGELTTVIRQLSNGHFSDENQKRLNSSSGVPIFEAKMQRDLRLVVGISCGERGQLFTPKQYQVDVVPDHDGKVSSTCTYFGTRWSGILRRLNNKVSGFNILLSFVYINMTSQ